MHKSALINGKLFFETYLEAFQTPTIIEIGAQDVNGSLRDVCPQDVTYVGVDFVEGKGVDVVLTDPYHFPFADGTADVIVSSSCLEHSEMFWIVFIEMLRVLKPNGLLYLNVPSNAGYFHRYPVDCWRFMPDSGHALVTWAKLLGHNPLLLESYVSNKNEDFWTDFVGVFVKDAHYQTQHPKRILNTFQDIRDGFQNTGPSTDPSIASQDSETISTITHWLNTPVTQETLDEAGMSEEAYRLEQIRKAIQTDWVSGKSPLS